MNQDSNLGLGEAGAVKATGQDRAEAALVGGDLAFDQPTLAIQLARKTAPERAAQGCQGPLATAIAAVETDDALRDPKRFEGVSQIGFGVVAGVGQDAVEGRPLMSLGNERLEVRNVPGGSQAHPGRQEERGLKFGHESNFDPADPSEPSRRTAVSVVVADMARVQARGIDGGDGPVWDQAPIAGRSHESVEEGVEGSFFSKRFSATQRVE